MERKNTKQEDFEKILGKAVVRKKNADLVERWEEKLKKEHGVKRKKDDSSNYLKWIAIGAVMLALVCLTYFFMNRVSADPVQIAEQRIETSALLRDPGFSVRGNNGQEIHAEKEAYQLLEKAEIDSALKIYNSILEQEGSLGPKSKYYYAWALAKNKHWNESTKVLNDIIAEQRSYTEESKWLLGLVLASNNRLSESRIIFEEIVENKFYKHQEAKELLQSLNK